MFDIRVFVMNTLRKMYTLYPEAQVREFALDYYAKGWITDEDLSEVDSWYSNPEPEEDPDSEAS